MTARFRQVDATAQRLVDRLLAAPPTLGTGRFVCVDGPSGSGKTTLAAALNRCFRDALRSPGAAADRADVRLLHMDNLYPGWSGLEAAMAVMAEQVVAPLRRGEAGRYRRWDWHRSRYAEERVIEPCRVLVVEGVGAGNTAYDDVVGLLVWVDAPADVRLDRALARDGEQARAQLLAWREQETAVLARQRTHARADVVVDGR